MKGFNHFKKAWKCAYVIYEWSHRVGNEGNFDRSINLSHQRQKYWPNWQQFQFIFSWFIKATSEITPKAYSKTPCQLPCCDLFDGGIFVFDPYYWQINAWSLADTFYLICFWCSRQSFCQPYNWNQDWS